MPSTLRRLIGDRKFYAMVMAVVIPIIVQNAISNFVNLLDNLMVGRIGTDQMSGVAITNQLMFVFNLTIFGAVSGAGIFAAQYHGAGNTEGVRASLRYKLYISLIICSASIILFLAAGDKLVSLYLTDTSDPTRVQLTLDYALEYLRIMLLGLLPFSIAQCYAGTLRETGETALPMYASIASVFVNLIFNYLLIFGKFGFPMLGIAGAAYATVLSRYVELAIILIYTHTHIAKHPFASGLFSTLRIPGTIVREISIKGMPLLINELLWSMGKAMLIQIYTVRGLDVVAATNISNTVNNLFSVAFLAMGSAAAIIVGQALGANDIRRAKDHAVKLLAFSAMISTTIGLAMFALSRFIPLLYNTTASVHDLSTQLIRVIAIIMPFHALANCSYFILRSGGKTGITFLFDSAYVWITNLPLAYALTYLTDLSVVVIFLCVSLLEFVKSLLGIFLIHKGIWVNNIVSGEGM